MEIILALIALGVGAAALAEIGSLRRRNDKVLSELKALRDAVDAFEAPARGEAPAAVVNLQAPAPTPVSAVTPPEIPAHILAVIAASVAGVIRGQYRILAIQAASQPQTVVVTTPEIDWSLEGRREIYSSHNLR